VLAAGALLRNAVTVIVSPALAKSADVDTVVAVDVSPVCIVAVAAERVSVSA
jgi:hypothetical protein